MTVRSMAARWGAPLLRRLGHAGMVPGYLIVGTKRGGSTSVADWVNKHPEVAPCRAAKGTHYFDVNFARGWDWYLSKFEPASSRWRTTGEASPYYMFHPLAAERIGRALPGVRIIVSLREPVARAWSHHQYETQKGHEDRSFEEALELEESRLAGEEERMRRDPTYESYSHRHHSYLTRGRYAEQLERLYEHVAAEQVLVVRTESMFVDPAAQLSRIWQHLGVRDVPLPELSHLKATNTPPAISQELSERLSDYYRPWNERLAALPGVGFTWDDVN